MNEEILRELKEIKELLQVITSNQEQEKHIKKENQKEGIKYFVAGYEETFNSKKDAIHFSNLIGVSRSQVSMIVSPELTEKIVRRVYSQNLV